MAAAVTHRERDYSLLGQDAKRADERGLHAAEWYHSELSRKRMKELMRRRDLPALRDTAIWFLALVVFAYGAYVFWGSWECLPFFVCYGVLYGSASNSRWHEAGHGTAFKTPWMNDVLYQIASFMTLLEPTVSRWSHTRHHTDTIIVGLDPEIAPMRPPPDALALDTVGLRTAHRVGVSLVRHAAGRLTPDEQVYVPDGERHRVTREARVWLVVFIAVALLCVYTRSILPLLFVGLPSLYGRWLILFLSISQHGGLAEDVLDHRLNSRTIKMNPVMRFLYWNMNYHVEHHMFPMVPYHALPQLHAEIGDDLPPPCNGILATCREMLPALWRQRRDPDYCLERVLPSSAKPFRPELHDVVLS